MVLIALLPLIAASLVPYIVGVFWYHPRIFGKVWMHLRHITPEMVEHNTRRATESSMLLIILGGMSALVLNYTLAHVPTAGFIGSAMLAVAITVAFIIPPTIGTVLWDHKPLTLYVVELGQWCVSLIIMAAMLSLL